MADLDKYAIVVNVDYMPTTPLGAWGRKIYTVPLISHDIIALLKLAVMYGAEQEFVRAGKPASDFVKNCVCLTFEDILRSDGNAKLAGKFFVAQDDSFSFGETLELGHITRTFEYVDPLSKPKIKRQCVVRIQACLNFDWVMAQAEAGRLQFKSH